jgi:hypothetical protein
VDESGRDMHAAAKTPATALTKLPYQQLCPGNAALQQLQRAYR